MDSTRSVMSNDDLLQEIIIRLPVISLVRFKSVSKRWLSIITMSKFTLRRNLDPPSGLFLSQHKNRYNYNFVPLDATIPSNRYLFKNILPLGFNTRKFTICQSCNGLILCRIARFVARICIFIPEEIYVYNPTINMFKKLPELHELEGAFDSFGCARMVFDPRKSPHYKVVYASVFNDYVSRPSTHLQIYSSETCSWNVCGVQFDTEIFERFPFGICWNNGIHWLKIVNGSRLLFTLDVESLVFTSIETPDTSKGYKLFESGGCLLLANIHSQHLNVYEMNDAGWSVKYNVNLDGDVSILFPKASVWSDLYYLKCIVVGERENDSYLVMEIDGKAVQYNIVLKTLHHIFDLRETCNYEFFEFIASFARV